MAAALQHQKRAHAQLNNIVCGIEAPKRLVYKGWEPGGEYTKRLVLKNVKVSAQKISYK